MKYININLLLLSYNLTIINNNNNNNNNNRLLQKNKVRVLLKNLVFVFLKLVQNQILVLKKLSFPLHGK